jgi:hypothetical protein
VQPPGQVSARESGEMPAASGGGAGCGRLGLLAQALDVLRTEGEHHRRFRQFGCGLLSKGTQPSLVARTSWSLGPSRS